MGRVYGSEVTAMLPVCDSVRPLILPYSGMDRYPEPTYHPAFTRPWRPGSCKETT